MNLATRIELIADADRHVRFGECYVRKGRLDTAIRRFGQAAADYASAGLGGLAKAARLRLAEIHDVAGDVEQAAAERAIANKIDAYEFEEENK